MSYPNPFRPRRRRRHSRLPPFLCLCLSLSLQDCCCEAQSAVRVPALPPRLHNAQSYILAVRGRSHGCKLPRAALAATRRLHLHQQVCRE